MQRPTLQQCGSAYCLEPGSVAQPQDPSSCEDAGCKVRAVGERSINLKCFYCPELDTSADICNFKYLIKLWLFEVSIFWMGSWILMGNWRFGPSIQLWLLSFDWNFPCFSRIICRNPCFLCQTVSHREPRSPRDYKHFTSPSVSRQTRYNFGYKVWKNDWSEKWQFGYKEHFSTHPFVWEVKCRVKGEPQWQLCAEE